MGVTVTGCTKMALTEAARYDYLNIIKYLHQEMGVTEYCAYILNPLIANGKLETVKYLYEQMNITEYTKRAIDMAYDDDHYNVINYLRSENK